MRHRYQVQCCYMLERSSSSLTQKYALPSDIYPMQGIPQTLSVSAELVHPYLSWTILWRIDLSNVFKSHPSTSSDRCGRNPVQAYVAILSTILPNYSIKLTPRMSCMSASVDMPSQFSVWRNTPALVEFTSLEHQLHSLNDWSNQVSIKLWLISLPALAFVFW